VGTYGVGGRADVIAFDGQCIWVGSGCGVVRLGLDGSVLGSYGVGGEPCDIVFDGTNMWVGTNTSMCLTAFKASDGTLAGSYSIGTMASYLAFDGINLWVAGSHVIAKVNPSDGSVMGTYLHLDNMYSGPMAFDGTNLWVVDSTSQAVVKVRTSDGGVLGKYKVGRQPQGIAFDGADIWVANNDYNCTVTQLRASDGRHVKTWNVGSRGGDIVFDGEYIWVTQCDSDSVTRLSVAKCNPNNLGFRSGAETAEAIYQTPHPFCASKTARSPVDNWTPFARLGVRAATPLRARYLPSRPRGFESPPPAPIPHKTSP